MEGEVRSTRARELVIKADGLGFLVFLLVLGFLGAFVPLASGVMCGVVALSLFAARSEAYDVSRHTFGLDLEVRQLRERIAELEAQKEKSEAADRELRKYAISAFWLFEYSITISYATRDGELVELFSPGPPEAPPTWLIESIGDDEFAEKMRASMDAWALKYRDDNA